MLAPFRSGFDLTARLERFVDDALIGYLDMLGKGGYIRLLLLLSQADAGVAALPYLYQKFTLFLLSYSNL
jgi:hypothetical protein